MGKTTFLSLRYIDKSDKYDELFSYQMYADVHFIMRIHFIMMLG